MVERTQFRLWRASLQPARQCKSWTVEVAEDRNSLVHSDDILTAVVGLDDIVVVAQPDAVLVTARNHSGMVKEVVAALRDERRPEAGERLRMHRPWGWYQHIDRGCRFQVKRIMVEPGGRLPLQTHHHRAGHWVVVKGTAEVTVDDTVSLVHENESIPIPAGSMHRLANPGRIPLELIEVEVVHDTGEDDVVPVETIDGHEDTA